MAAKKFIAPKAQAPMVGPSGAPTMEWQRYLNGIQELEGLVAALTTRQAELSYFVGSGAGSPEGVIAAAVGSIYTQTNGGAGTVFWVKETGAATSTGWDSK